MIINPAQSVAAMNNTSQKEVDGVTAIADTGVYASFTATYLSGAASAQGDYIGFTNKAGTTYALWLDIDADGTAPSGAVYTAAANKTKVSIVSGDTAAQVAAKVAAKTATNVTIAQVGATAVVSFTNTKIGVGTTPASHNTGDTGAGTIAVGAIIAGVASNYQSKYFTLHSGTADASYYGWFSVGSEGVDPAPGGTGIGITFSAGATATAAATAIASGIDGSAAFEAASSGAAVEIKNAVGGQATNIGAGTSPVTVTTKKEGYAGSDKLIHPDDAVDSLNNNP